MRRLFAILLAAVLLAAMVAPAFAAVGHVRGNFVVSDYPEDPIEDQTIQVNFTEPDKGLWRWANRYIDWKALEGDPDGFPSWQSGFAKAWSHAEAACVNVVGSEAYVAMQITRGPGLPSFFEDYWLLVKFHDGGPNGLGDYIEGPDLDAEIGEGLTEAEAVSYCEAGMLPTGDSYVNPVLDGDIKVG